MDKAAAERAELARLDKIDRPHTVDEADRSRELAQRVWLREQYGVDPDSEG